MNTTAALDDVYRVIYNDHYDPFYVLGPHIENIDGTKCLVVRAFIPDAESLSVIAAVRRRLLVP